jgi:hypothetical protein
MGMAFRGRLSRVDFPENVLGTLRTPMGLPMIPFGLRRRLRNPQAWVGGRGKPLNVRRLKSIGRITERLAGRVKGVTAVFCGLLWLVINGPATALPFLVAMRNL